MTRRPNPSACFGLRTRPGGLAKWVRALKTARESITGCCAIVAIEFVLAMPLFDTTANAGTAKEQQTAETMTWLDVAALDRHSQPMIDLNQDDFSGVRRRKDPTDRVFSPSCERETKTGNGRPARVWQPGRSRNFAADGNSS